jgi:hypothetical protein
VKSKEERVFPGLKESSLPELEIALSLKANLFREFITTRVEASVLTLLPELIQLGMDNDCKTAKCHDLDKFDIVFPTIGDIPPLVMTSIRVVVYEVK